MEFNGLYEPKTRERDTGEEVTFFRAVAIDLDTYRDAAHTAARELGKVAGVTKTDIVYEVTSPGPYQGSRVVAESELDSLSGVDRNRLVAYVSAAREDGWALAHLTIWAVLGSAAMISTGAEPNISLDQRALRFRVLHVLLDEGRPRVDVHKLRRLSLFIPLAGLIAGAVWLVVSSSLPIAAYIALAALLAFVATFTVSHYRRLSREEIERSVGCLVIMENRAKTASRRADHKRDRRVAYITGAVSLVVGIAVGIFLAVLGIKS